jgi:hypothetical protein
MTTIPGDMTNHSVLEQYPLDDEDMASQSIDCGTTQVLSFASFSDMELVKKTEASNRDGKCGTSSVALRKRSFDNGPVLEVENMLPPPDT